MARHASTQPTEVELQILRILWEHGASTVRFIHDTLATQEGRDTGHQTTVKMLSVMHTKGLVKRDDSIRPLKYRAAKTQKSTQRTMANDLIRKAFNGSAKTLVMQVLSGRRASSEDLDEIRELINKLEEGKS